MVASGVAMFSLSGKQILRIHDAWLAYVAPDDEHESQLYWGGARRFTIEREKEGGLVLERAILADDLPPAVRAAIPAIAPLHAVTMIEEVGGLHSNYHEIYYRHGTRILKTDLTPEGTPHRSPS